LKKSDFYNAYTAIKGVYNTHNSIDKMVHGRKRRVLSQAFSDNALKGMEDVMLIHIRRFCAILAGEPAGEGGKYKNNFAVQNLAEWFGYLTYDVMGELCFGKSFDMLIDSTRRRMVHLVDRAAYRHYVVRVTSPLSPFVVTPPSYYIYQFFFFFPLRIQSSNESTFPHL
jgi:cytochrome P450